MENFDTDIMDLLDITLSEDQLNSRIANTQNLKSLIILLELKKQRILKEKVQKIYYPVHQIYEQENVNIDLQCAVLKSIFFVIGNPQNEILQVLSYLNLQLERVNFSNYNAVNKMAGLLNEIVLICKTQRMEHLFQENMHLDCIDKFLFHVFQTQNSSKINVLSTVLPNYIGVLTKLQQQNFLTSYFLQRQDLLDLDVLCVAFDCVDKRSLSTNCQSIFFLNDFWQYIETCISCNVYGQQKQAIYLLKKFVKELYRSDNLKCECPHLKISSGAHEAPNQIWQHFFILLDASKEKQLHLIWPSMPLLSSLEYIHSLWQICVYKKLLAHSQNTIVHFVASYLLRNNIFFPTLNKYFLSAINKNEYTYYCKNTFKELLNFCNNLETENFIQFVEDIAETIWVPTAAWYFFVNTFSEELNKTIPFKVFKEIYRLLNHLPHVYIRNGCILIFLNYFVRNCNWKTNFHDVLKLLSILKVHDDSLFIKMVSDHIDVDFINNILFNIEDGVLDINEFDVFIEIIKVTKYKTGIENIPGYLHTLNNTFRLIVYKNLFEIFKRSDIETFILDQITELDNDHVELVVAIFKKLQNIDESEVVNSKMLHILNKCNNYSKSAVYVALKVIVSSCKSNNSIIKSIKELRSKFFEYGKTDDSLCVLFLEFYFSTEEYPEICFLEHILHNQSDTVISKMFECLSSFKFHKNYLNIIHFFREVLNTLPHLTKTKHFKSIILNYINCIFSVSFLVNVCENDMFDIITETTGSLLSLSETFPIIDYYISEKIKNSMFSSGFHKKYCYILIPIVEELLLKGMIIKKDDRVEYYACQEIFEKLGATENPNLIKIFIRMSSLESMLQIVQKYPEIADDFTARLVKRYRIHFNKRYFPDSQIHLQKLRIIQALLTIHPFIKSQRQVVIDLIEESFCVEIHQTCVKQLMQWLLLSLLKDQDYFNSIRAKIDTTTKTVPSTIVAFIVVLLHLTLDREESYWFPAVEALIPWSMGAHFKLRVYSQAAIKKLLEEAKEKHYGSFLAKFSYLEKSIHSVIEASGSAFYETLKSDELFFSTFEPNMYYSLETIYIDIPKLNVVTRTEWENIFKYKFIAHKFVNTYNENRSFTNSVTMSIENNNKAKTNEDLFEHTYNIQRKIDPWKNISEERGNKKEISEFILIASLIDKSTNLGGLSRTCEVFGVKQMVLSDVKILRDKEFKSLSMSSEEWVNAIEVKTSKLKNFICEIRNKGYSVIGAEQTSNSTCLDKYKFNKKTALVLGNEKEGIPPDIIPILDACIEIPQFGLVRSLNVHVAGATFIWEYTKQHLIK